MTAALANFSTADLYDCHGHDCDSCQVQFTQYGRRRIFSGRIQTIKTVDDNVLLREMLERKSEGDVLVVDGAGYMGSALIGDRIARLGSENGWAGIILYGAIRDANALGTLEFGVKALGTNPKRSGKQGTGRKNVSVSFGGVSFVPGYWVYSDDDGILISAKNLSLVSSP